MNTLKRSVRAILKDFDKRFPLTIHTGAGRLFTTVRRMKAEREADIPINLRTGFAISVKTSKAASEMTKREWEDFYKQLCKSLKKDYPGLYKQIFPSVGREVKKHKSRKK